MDIILTRILECMGNKYGAGKELANYLGLSGNVITNWKNGSNHSYMKYLPQIAEFYDVSESYLLGKSDSKLRPAVLEEVQDILSDPDIVMFARHTKKIPEADRKRILDNFSEYLPKFKKIIPYDYYRMQMAIIQMEEKGLSSEQAQIEAFYANRNQ